MIELDFIPQWYQAKRSRRLWYQRQFFIVCLAAVGVSLWCLAAGRGLSKARAQLNAAYSDFELGIGKIQQCEELSSRYSQLQKQTKILDLIIPRTSYASVLAELSHCIGPEMVIRNLKIFSEPIMPEQQTVSGKMKKLNSISGANQSAGKPPVTQTCIVLTGYAADAKRVAELIASLEQSSYFNQVVPTYSKNETLDERNVTDFEIRCVLADFELSGREE